MPVKIQVDGNKIRAKVEGAFGNGLEKLSTEILADCNEYCKMDTGALILSSLIHSQLDKGILVWQTPYARRQYYEIKTASKDKNEKATMQWCEAAKAEYLTKWERQAQIALRENL